MCTLKEYMYTVQGESVNMQVYEIIQCCCGCIQRLSSMSALFTHSCIDTCSTCICSGV